MKLTNNAGKTIVLISLMFFLCSFSNNLTKKIKDYLSIGQEMSFDGEDYFLEWSANPSTAYYIQEYLRKEDNNLKKFNKMLMVSVVDADVPVKEAVAFKVVELKQLKQNNPVINYEVFENKEKKESIIDFVISDGAFIYEWNLYRYLKQKDKLVLLSYVYRDSLNTNEDLIPFFGHIKENRAEMTKKLGEFEIPKIKIKKR